MTERNVDLIIRIVGTGFLLYVVFKIYLIYAP